MLHMDIVEVSTRSVCVYTCQKVFVIDDFCSGSLVSEQVEVGVNFEHIREVVPKRQFYTN